MSDNKAYVTLTDANFEAEVLRGDQPVLVDFWATWCPPCRAIAPTIEQLARDFEGKVKVGKLDVDQNPETAQRFAIRSIPTLLVFDGGKEVDRTIGAASKAALEQKLEAFAPVA